MSSVNNTSPQADNSPKTYSLDRSALLTSGLGRGALLLFIGFFALRAAINELQNIPIPGLIIGTMFFILFICFALYPWYRLFATTKNINIQITQADIIEISGDKRIIIPWKNVISVTKNIHMERYGDLKVLGYTVTSIDRKTIIAYCSLQHYLY